MRLRFGLRFTGALIAIAAWIANGRWTLTIEVANVLLASAEGGALQMIWVRESYYGDTFEAIWWPRNPPGSGLRARDFRLGWGLPALGKSFVSTIGTWWTIRVPLWPLVMFSVWFAFPYDWRFALRRYLNRFAFSPGTRPHRWLNRTCWAALAVTFCLWAVSGRVALWVHLDPSRELAVSIMRGCITLQTHPFEGFWANTPPFYFEECWRPGWDWTVPHSASSFQSSIGRWEERVIPLWFPALLFGGVAL